MPFLVCVKSGLFCLVKGWFCINGLLLKWCWNVYLMPLKMPYAFVNRKHFLHSEHQNQACFSSLGDLKVSIIFLIKTFSEPHKNLVLHERISRSAFSQFNELFYQSNYQLLRIPPAKTQSVPFVAPTIVFYTSVRVFLIEEIKHDSLSGLWNCCLAKICLGMFPNICYCTHSPRFTHWM